MVGMIWASMEILSEDFCCKCGSLVVIAYFDDNNIEARTGDYLTNSIKDVLALNGRVSPKNGAENLQSFFTAAVISAQGKRKAFTIEDIQDIIGVFVALRRKIGIIENPIVEFALLVLFPHQINGRICSISAILGELKNVSFNFI